VLDSFGKLLKRRGEQEEGEEPEGRRVVKMAASMESSTAV
jgi:hypothetical protein